MFVPAPSTSRLPEIIIRPFGGPGGGASFYGGTLITGTAAEYSKFRDGQRYDWTDHLDGYCEDPIDPNPEYCEGELKTYSFTKWVFTADDKGFYLEYLTTRNTCNGPIEGSSYLGDKDYAPGASDWPHDHQWTAILMKGTEDIDGQLLTPTLVYVDGETDNNLFYGQKNGVTQISEEGNRAFFQYASREYFKEMIYGSD
jgi:hypothetical protein